MMILSRMWYVILALLLAAAYYVVSLAVGQYNRRNNTAMEDALKADSQAVSWAMQVDARRRLETLLLAATDPAIGKALRGASGKDQIPPASREEAAKALRDFNDKLPVEYKNDALFATDRDGRLVAQVGFNRASPEFELGGYPAVFDALHGFLRDDTWVWDGRMGRVVAHPVEDEVGQPPVGAIVGIRWIDNAFAKDIGKRTHTNVAFFALGKGVAQAATTEGLDDSTLEGMGADLKRVSEDKGFRETGHTDVRPFAGARDKGGAIYALLPGDGWELGAGFLVARPRVSIPTAMGFIHGADDQDKKNVKLWAVAAIALGASAIGILFSLLEHTRPMREMVRQAARLKTGEIDVLSIPEFRGGFRSIADDINEGIHRVVEKGGGTARKPADLESILGPVPAQPAMSAFSFPDRSSPVPSLNQNIASQAAANLRPPISVNAGPPSPLAGARPVAPGLKPPPPPIIKPAAGAPPKPPPPLPPPALATKTPAVEAEMDDEQTMVAARTSSDSITAAGPTIATPGVEWPAIYEEFLRTKRECNESTEGLTFEKFAQTLAKNRDALMQRHGCKRVKFSVYVKEGRASLKATPLRE
ncbi:MAG: hypothetical protein FWD69_13995 [Polyangiaceae bacterium]|nr:hypothetical protein [Polyangiaceae bacterium]